MFHVKQKQKYYDMQNILKTDSQYHLLLGERSNGKSYQVKKYVIDDFNKNGNTFIFLRRAKEEVKTAMVESYFTDLLPYINGLYPEYNYVSVYRGYIYLANLDHETQKVTRGVKIGDVAYLSGVTHFKSLSYPMCKNIIFEEFVTDGLYHIDEPNMLQDFVSTVFRRRNGKVFLIGNVISRTCPYFYEWGLTRIPKQKQGTIDLYEHVTDQIHEDGTQVTVKIAVEYCENSGKNSQMFFGHYSKTITSGAWKTYEQPKQPEPNKTYDVIYEFRLEHKNFNFICQLKVNVENGGIILFVYPNTKNRDNIERIITHKFSDNPFTSKRLDGKQFEIENLVIETIRKEKICFANNMTGTDFNDIIKEMGGIY